MHRQNPANTRHILIRLTQTSEEETPRIVTSIDRYVGTIFAHLVLAHNDSNQCKQMGKTLLNSEKMSLNPLANPKGVKLNCELCQKPAFIQCTKCHVTYYL